MEKINEAGIPFAIKCETESECLAFIDELKNLGFKYGGWKGHFNGDTFAWVNIHNKTYSYGIPGIKLCKHMCNKAISLPDFREIMRIFDIKPGNS
jgi:hypothetical protein